MHAKRAVQWGQAVLIAVLLSGCTGAPLPGSDDATDPAADLESPANPPLAALDTLWVGVSISPRTTDEQGLAEFFQSSQEMANVIIWMGDWANLGDHQGVAQQLGQFAWLGGLRIALVLQVFDPITGDLYRPLTEQTLDEYRSHVVEFADRFRPLYISLGMDMNTLEAEDPAAYQTFVEFFPGAVSAVKAVSPGTTVFTSFQYERLLGREDGLFGGSAGPARWELTSDFPAADALGYSTYTALVFRDPALIPEGYLQAVVENTDKTPLWIAAGWHAGDLGPGWDSSPAEQDDYVRWYLNNVVDTEPGLVSWSFLYDPPLEEPFNSMGLRDDTDSARPGWGTWTTWYEGRD